EGRPAVGCPARLRAEQAAVLPTHDHDHRGVDAREVIERAGGIGAPRAMAERDEFELRAAGAAPARARLPVRERARIGEQAGLLRTQPDTRAAQVDPAAAEFARRERG